MTQLHALFGCIALLFFNYCYASPLDVAHKLYAEQHYKDAFEAYKEALLTRNVKGEAAAESLHRAIDSLRKINRLKTFDAFIEQVLERYPDNGALRARAAREYRHIDKYGYRIDGQFQRGYHRGQAQYLRTDERDRIRAIQLYREAIGLLAKQPAQKAAFTENHFELAETIMDGRQHHSWKLQQLSELSKLPDYESSTDRDNYPSFSSAPVNRDNKPLFYSVPTTFDNAKNDGERWRYLLHIAGQNTPARSQWLLAHFLWSQFGVHTLAGNPWFHPRAEDDSIRKKHLFTLDTLSDDESIAKLASGIQRFSLPEPFNFIRHFKSLMDSDYKVQAIEKLATLYQNRRQRSLAAQYWRLLLEASPKKHQHRQNDLDQIVGAWGRFEARKVAATHNLGTVFFRYRNASSVALKIQAIKSHRFLSDLKKRLQSNPQSYTWSETQLSETGRQILWQNQTQYLGQTLHSWHQTLNPGEAHHDKRAEISLPTNLPGSYLLTASVAGGNTSYVVIWNHKKAIATKNFGDKRWFFIADAMTGKPLAQEELVFFGFRRQNLSGKGINNTVPLKRRYHTDIKTFRRNSNETGQVLIDQNTLANYQWIVHSTSTADAPSDFAFLGASRWYGHKPQTIKNRQRAFIMTSRPVYRPGQTLSYKAWISHGGYGPASPKDVVSKQRVPVDLLNNKGEKIHSTNLYTDAYGGVQGRFTLPDKANLGQYRIAIQGMEQSAGTFRVEEYKKPEFELSINPAEESASLGAIITATVKANYYFGTPVAHGLVQYKVYRDTQHTNWFPRKPWDWLYGNGYSWQAYDASWYPGWSRWGKPGPLWHGWPQPASAPELVQENTIRLDKNGEAVIAIDTSLAKLLAGNHDHRYTIRAEVRDQSRRTIYGETSIMATQKPFEVSLWLDQGYYTANVPITAYVKAQTRNQTTIEGQGQAKLYRVNYAGDGSNITETLLQTWVLNTNKHGDARLKFNSGQPGQYRLAYTLKNAQDQSVEGAQLFTVIGSPVKVDNFRFNDIELMTEKSEYKAGDTLRLLINSKHNNAHVVLFARPVNGHYSTAEVIQLKGKSHIQPIPVSEADRPNFYIEALSISNGVVLSDLKEIFVPPVEKQLNVSIQSPQETLSPGDSLTLHIQVTDSDGKPVVGALAVTVYDKALDYIADPSTTDIAAYFWQWRRQHTPAHHSSLSLRASNISKKNAGTMWNIGLFDSNPQFLAQPGTAINGRYNDTIELASDTESPGFSGQRTIAAPSQKAMRRLKSFVPDNTAQSTSASIQQTRTRPTRIRQNFADYAYWQADIVTDKAGKATIRTTLPENLTTWQIRVWSLDHGTRVGQSQATVTSSKDLLVRLQTPRFLTEKDRMTLSANVHNDLPSKQRVAVTLSHNQHLKTAVDTPLTQTITVDANSEQRVDWQVNAHSEGLATVAVSAVGDDASDGMTVQYPIQVHGINKVDSFSGTLAADEPSGQFTFRVPEKRNKTQTALELVYSPSLAASMVAALPYLIHFPYGCTEQTLNRFLPTVIVQKFLQDTGLAMPEPGAPTPPVANQHQKKVARTRDKKEAADVLNATLNTALNKARVDDLVQTGIARLLSMQLSGGGWGWFSGHGERSSAHTTATVLRGLQVAIHNGVTVPSQPYERGLQWLLHHQNQERQKLDNARQKTRPFKHSVSNLDALVAYVLQKAGVLQKTGKDSADMLDYLYQQRQALSTYARVLLALTLHEAGQKARRDTVKGNLDQLLEIDAENQTAYLELGNQHYWWHWYGSEFEAQAYYLKLLTRLDPKSTVAPMLVKYLLNNRQYAKHWHSTRDTALVVEAMADYLSASGETTHAMSLDFFLNDTKIESVTLDKDHFNGQDHTLHIGHQALDTGQHQLRIEKSGQGPLYYSAYLSNFTREDPVRHAGLEVKIRRKMYRLQASTYPAHAQTVSGPAQLQQRESYQSVPLDEKAQLKSGDLVEVELLLTSKNDYEYIVVEDMKAAGFETVQRRSGYLDNAPGTYMELRDNRTVFFIKRLPRGKSSIKYRLRAEIPGAFSALPATISAMYAPALKGNSDETKVRIED